MADIDFRWKNRGFYDIRRDPKVIDALERMGTHIVNEANAKLGEDGYDMSSTQGKRAPQGRWHVRVYTRTNKAKAAEARDHHLDYILGTAGGSE
jgi:hypothetical protein